MAKNVSGKGGEELPVIERLMMEKPPNGKKMNETSRAKPQAAQTGKKNKAEPKKKKSKAKAVLLVILLLVLAAAGTIGYFAITGNLFGGRDLVIETLESALVYLDRDYKTVEEKKAELGLREAELLTKEESLLKKEESLKAQSEAQATVTQGGTLSNFESLIAGLTQERKEQITQISSIYNSMEPKKAADAVTKLSSLEDMALVTYFMKQKSAAEMMANLSSDMAARITAFMLN